MATYKPSFQRLQLIEGFLLHFLILIVSSDVIPIILKCRENNSVTIRLFPDINSDHILHRETREEKGILRLLSIFEVRPTHSFID